MTVRFWYLTLLHLFARYLLVQIFQYNCACWNIGPLLFDLWNGLWTLPLRASWCNRSYCLITGNLLNLLCAINFHVAFIFSLTKGCCEHYSYRLRWTRVRGFHQSLIPCSLPGFRFDGDLLRLNTVAAILIILCLLNLQKWPIISDEGAPRVLWGGLVRFVGCSKNGRDGGWVLGLARDGDTASKVRRASDTFFESWRAPDT